MQRHKPKSSKKPIAASRVVLVVGACVGVAAAIALLAGRCDAPAETSESAPSDRETLEEPGTVDREPDPAPLSQDETALRRHPCEHPLLASLPGTELRYDVLTGGRVVAQYRTVTDAVHDDGSERAVAWRIGDGTPDGDLPGRIAVRCEVGSWAEDPWFQLPVEGGMTVTGSRGRWPMELRPGLVFDGEVTHQLVVGNEPVSLFETRRDYRVVGEEEVSVPAGTFTAWRVEVDERTRAAEQNVHLPTTLWVARGIGLVRALRPLSEGDAPSEYALRELILP